MKRSVIPLMMPLPSPAATATTSTNGSMLPHENPSSILPSSSLVAAPPREYFVVQRCWYSGPRQDVAPVDYLRILESPQEAQEAAYHSALAWSGLPSHMIATVAVRNHQDDQVETTTAYAACGSLFWIRRIWGTFVVETNENNNDAMYNNNNNQYQHRRPSSLFQHYNYGHDDGHDNEHGINNPTTAYCVLTEGVIGGTGNRNSRRGVEISKGRCFVGNAVTAARAAALQVARQLQQDVARQQAIHTSLSTLPNIQVVAIPIGKPAEYVTKRFVQEWYHPVVSSTSTLSSSSPPWSSLSATTTKLTSWKRSWSDQDMTEVVATADMDSNDPGKVHPRHSSSSPWIFASSPEYSNSNNNNSNCISAPILTSIDVVGAAHHQHAYHPYSCLPPMSKRPRRRCGASVPTHHPYHHHHCLGSSTKAVLASSPGSDEEVAAMDETACWS